MKLLLYCTKAKPYLTYDIDINKKYYFTDCIYKDRNSLNGKIVSECDFEVKELKYSEELLKKSCLTASEIFEYIKKSNIAYEIHIKNLHIFDKPKELNNKIEPIFTILNADEYENMHCDCCYSNKDCKKCYYHYNTKEIVKAPQNMCKVFYRDDDMKVLISIKPEWLCKILNGEKTIEIRKKVLKEML